MISSLRLALAAGITATMLLPVGAQTIQRPRLVVVLSVDQFRGDLMRRFTDLYEAKGFRRLMREGRQYPNCYYRSANTETGPGHATMLTGSYANRNGIVGNNWFDDAENGPVYCVGDKTTRFLTSAGVADQIATSPVLKAAGLAAQTAASPRRLLSDTVGDQLEVATQGAARTVSISIKDRAAVLMAGHSADTVIWFSPALGEFVSSDFYGAELPKWVRDFNSRRHADQYFKKPWDLLLSPDNYKARCQPDNHAAEGTGAFSTNTFPHIWGEKSERMDKEYYESVAASPASNTLVIDAAIASIRDGKLGSDATTDLLTLSLSANDTVGHAFGPDSWEVMDITLRTDRELSRLFTALDEEVGFANWTFFITADHGVATMPEILKELRIDAGRVDRKELTGRIDAALKAKLGASKDGESYIRYSLPQWLTLNEAANGADVAGATVEILRAEPVVAFALKADVVAQAAPGEPIMDALRLSAYAGRTGQVAYALKPNYFYSTGATGTNHGSLNRYDQWVVMAAMGRGIQAGVTMARVEPPQIAPTISTLLGIVPPALCEVEVLPDALTLR